MGYCDGDAVIDGLMIHYHDKEWGVPVHDDKKQFGFFIMECGLNWAMMMARREVFRSCFDAFDYARVASNDESDIRRIMGTSGMIHSRRKMEAVVNNACRFQDIRKEFGSFASSLWKWSGGRTILYEKHEKGWIPSSNGLSEAISKDEKARGFTFSGSVTVYAHLQACGIINEGTARAMGVSTNAGVMRNR